MPQVLAAGRGRTLFLLFDIAFDKLALFLLLLELWLLLLLLYLLVEVLLAFEVHWG